MWILGLMDYIYSQYLRWDTFKNTQYVPETRKYRTL